ncbi:AMSH-like ubiquitin thioesterase 3 isoform X2 [Carex littledalei]|uniref:AMSH-like ubiquitin thioesterase 3 isoform X2 n=1 Tax=Carex littledalei TaxID=544730 RepID=A0A833VI52_9POAL|nr:AMSH-like ubiquitin thioesterase 3 isoform X2 [Carex littledalei]
MAERYLRKKWRGVAKIYREEKNLIDLYIILVRCSSLLCETVPAHRDYGTFKSREKSLFRKKLLDALSELETIKPAVQHQINTHNRAIKLRKETSASSSSSTYTSTVSSPQNYQTCWKCTWQLEQAIGYKESSGSSGSISETEPRNTGRSINVPYPKEETLSRHSILGPNGLRGNWTGPVTGIRVQYPSSAGLTQSDVSGQGICAHNFHA